MRLHANARLSLIRRRELALEVVERGRALTEAAEAAGVSARTQRNGLCTANLHLCTVNAIRACQQPQMHPTTRARSRATRGLDTALRAPLLRILI